MSAALEVRGLSWEMPGRLAEAFLVALAGA
jgi:hypothetical protein